MNPDQLLLIDLSGIAHQLWHVSGKEPDQDFVSNGIVARVHALSSAHPHAAICCDSGKSKRKEIDPTYKAQRDTENRAPLQHQIGLACERLKRDGYPVWSAEGWEADDVIATATRLALECDPNTSVLIASADKDLLQLVSERVTAKSLTNGTVYDEAGVFGKLKVKPTQVLDYLSLVGDTSDNVKGAKGIGGVIAAQLLAEHGDITAIYAKMAQGVVPGLTPGIRAALTEFKDRWPIVRQLIALRTDVAIPFEEIAAERDVAPMATENGYDYDAALAEHNQREPSPPTSVEPEAHLDIAPETPNGETRTIPEPRKVGPQQSPVAPNAEGSGVPVKSEPANGIIEAPPPAEWELQLQPRSYRDLRVFAQDAHGSRKYMRNFETPQAAIMAVMSGRELGVPAMASLRGFHSIEGSPPMPNADLVRSIIIKSGKVEYFEPTERSATAAEFVIKRIGRPEVKLRYTIEEARTAYGFDVPMNDKDKADLERKWQKSSWGKNPADMLVARSSMKLGRLVCPDVCAGLYAKEEFDA